MITKEEIGGWLSEKLEVLRSKGVSATRVSKEVPGSDGKPLSRQSISLYKKGKGVSREWLERFCTTYRLEFPQHLFSANLTSELSALLVQVGRTQDAMSAKLTRMEEDLRQLRASHEALLRGSTSELRSIADEVLRALDEISTRAQPRG